MSVKTASGDRFATLIGVMALIVVVYRLIYIGFPIFQEGYNKSDIGLVLKSLTQLV
jgi:hypothetical protein